MRMRGQHVHKCWQAHGWVFVSPTAAPWMLPSPLVQRKRHDLAALVTGQDASPGAPPLPETWRSPAGFRAKCEEHLAGTTPARPGIIYLLRVLAGAEAWVDGSRREASWEVRACQGGGDGECSIWLRQG